MTNCLLGLGSNLGDREAILAAALAAIDGLPDVRVVRRSEWHRSLPVGGPPDQGEFINGAALIETSIAPTILLAELQGIESRHARQRAERWAPRTLDIDLLLYGSEVSETELLTLPHPRMSFRRFVLQPAAEIAPKMLHPVIGWPVERLLLHLDAAGDQAAVVSPADDVRGEAAALLLERFGAQQLEAPRFAAADQLWPQAITSWFALDPRARGTVPAAVERGGVPYAAAAFPKLTILLDAKTPASRAAQSHWSTIVRRPGRGPTLRLQVADSDSIRAEVIAAIASVWPDLGPASSNRLE
jgi:2-amino-4-hydroxy-6-hydroxymethyldihydropteridine diphosphokinase